ncbi:MAG: archaellin/type IV pilin N-terminal domain-containing protein [Candidatus Hodarchaeota archaeon]
MKSFLRLVNKKRAISPVIAVILLIGLAVAAVAAIFLVVLPLIPGKSNLQMDDAYIDYDDEYTKAADMGKGYGKGTLILSNTGTAEIDIVSLKVEYASSVLGPWTEITDHTGLLITKDNPFNIETLATLKELSVRFLIPDENDDNTVFYKITITTSDGKELDTATAENIDETEMDLAKDRPDISYTGTSLGYLRREEPIRPSQVSDNSEIKNVTYEVFFKNGTLAFPKTIQPPSTLWQWTWNTRNDTAEGLDNGTYDLRMTAYDYAGLSDTTDPISFTIDNDYTHPTIGGLWITDPYPNNQTAEVGQSISFTVEITDSGTEQTSASVVDSATLYYRIYGSVDEYSAAPSMSKFGTTNNWTTNIPSSFVDSTALENGIECYVSAEDLDGNEADTSGTIKVIPVGDHIKPDISHTPVTSANWDDLFINISATITDKDQVNESDVRLYYRQTDDYGGKTTSWVSLPPSIAGNGYFWLIWTTDITIHGLDYFFNATDRFSGKVANEGTEISPHHISIFDTLAPTIDHTAFTSATTGVDLTVECIIYDNDPTFGAENGEYSGVVTLYYRDNDGGGGLVFPTPMLKISGNSSIDNNYETPSSTIWSGLIPGGFINDDGNPSQLDYYITAVDSSTNLVQNGNPFHSVPVIAQGDPNIEFVPGSLTVGGTIGEEIYFEIENKFGSLTWAKITKLNLTILSSSADFTSDRPMLNMTQFNVTQVWADANPSNTNKTWITFTQNKTILHGDAAGITMTFENTTGQPYSMYDLDFILELQVYNDAETVSTKTVTFQTPPAEVTVKERLYMTSTFSLSTIGTTSPTEVETPWQNVNNPTIQIGIRVFVGGIEITNPIAYPVALVPVSNSWLERQGYWNCPQTILNPTDSVTISIRALIDSTEYTLASFSTGTLGAIELSETQWTINYWVRYRWQDRFLLDRYRAQFGFGDINSYDSFVDNFTYVI